MATTDPAELANENTRLLTIAYHHAITTKEGAIYTCHVCGEKVLGERVDLVHLPACVFAGKDRATLAALDGFEIAAGERL